MKIQSLLLFLLLILFIIGCTDDKDQDGEKYPILKKRSLSIQKKAYTSVSNLVSDINVSETQWKTDPNYSDNYSDNSGVINLSNPDTILFESSVKVKLIGNSMDLKPNHFEYSLYYKTRNDSLIFYVQDKGVSADVHLFKGNPDNFSKLYYIYEFKIYDNLMKSKITIAGPSTVPDLTQYFNQFDGNDTLYKYIVTSSYK